MDKQLNINDILNCEDTTIERVDVPEWGGYVMIQSMTAEGRDAYELSLLKSGEEGDFGRDLSNARAKLVAACTLSPNGDRMFKTGQQVEMLGKKSIKALQRVYNACMRINAISDEDMEEIEGN